MTKDDFINIIKGKKTAPFLFIGSGFTKHYLDTPDWETLLSKFTQKHINAYYTSLDTKDLSIVATEIAKECNKEFWSLPDDDEYKKSFQDKATNISSVLKDKIAKFFVEYSLKEPEETYLEELVILSKLNIDGIITTNWDDFCERQFPKFTKYVGQKELLFSKSIVNIGEIYKIHGCMREPESLVLTHEDYTDFNKRNAYLAAKLITIFIEHPIVFIGYSMNDNNIKSILASIVQCLDQDKIGLLQNNLFFVEWNRDADAEMEVERYDMLMSEGVTLPVIRIKTHEFKPVYECLATFERQMSANVLRFYKQQFYEIVYSEKPERKLYVLPEKEIETNKDIQFVCGFGTIAKYQSAVGYTGLKARDIFKDIVFQSGNYDSEALLTKTIPELRKSTRYIPIYKYLRAIGINSEDDYTSNQLGLNMPLLKQDDFCAYNFDEEKKRLSLDAALKSFPDTIWKICALIPYLSLQDEDLPILQHFIEENFNGFLISGNKKSKQYSTYFKKLICFYDWRKYAWE
ncbi:SIR2 family protein [Prevotella corporis]|uniref:SIR2 family protein n=1 Tax=Prevotella corporis TaxID=28128 RepID=UPI00041966BB|nr:SIR2 family protein [Prevotella corporis]